MNSAVIASIIYQAYVAGLLNYDRMIIAGYTVRLTIGRSTFNTLTINGISINIYDTDSEQTQEASIISLL